MYAIRILKHHGLEDRNIQDIFNAIIINCMLYSVNSWCQLLRQEDITHLDKILKCAWKLGYCSCSTPDFHQLADQRVNVLFNKVLNDHNHVLHYLIPTFVNHNHDLHRSNQHFSLPKMEGTHDTYNFIIYMLYKYMIHN